MGHFQFTQFDLQVFVVMLNKIMFEFHKWLERESLLVLFSELKGFTTEIYGYNANIKQPEQRNKPKNTTTYYLPQQTLVSRKPQQREAEHSGGLHGYMITKNQNMKTQWPQQTSRRRHNKHKNKPITTHHRQKWWLQPASISIIDRRIKSLSAKSTAHSKQYTPSNSSQMSSQEIIQSYERIKVRL